MSATTEMEKALLAIINEIEKSGKARIDILNAVRDLAKGAVKK